MWYTYRLQRQTYHETIKVLNSKQRNFRSTPLKFNSADTPRPAELQLNCNVGWVIDGGVTDVSLSSIGSYVTIGFLVPSSGISIIQQSNS